VQAANVIEVRAPIVGTFYRAASPDSPPYVEVGQKVKPGDLLCIIEAMKLMNEIPCEVAGIVKEVLIDNAKPVEYDQVLFLIETS
jgi:acetyl-CoA carboxylase biotin carboxyl carrier protein